MSVAAITGIGLLSAAGKGIEAFREALRRGEELGDREEVLVAGRFRRELRVARLAGFDAPALLSPRQIRRMSFEAQIVTSAFMMAWEEAACPARPCAPESVGTYLGSGFGSITTSAEYLRGLLTDGMATASPFLFSESLASSPLGHAAIALDARGPSMAFSGADSSITAALAAACRAIAEGRILRAVCCGFESMGAELLAVLARLSVKLPDPPAFGEGAAAFVLESPEQARRSGARILAGISAVAQAGDPAASPTRWSRDAEAWLAPCRSALARAGRSAGAGGIVIRHAPPEIEAARAEREALSKLPGSWREPEHPPVHRIFGAHAASGGLTAAAGALAAADARAPVLVPSGSWGGATGALLLTPEGA